MNQTLAPAPPRPGHEATAARHAALVAQACRHMEASPEPLLLADLAARSGLSPSHFHRVFKAATGLTPRAWAAAERARKLRRALRAGVGTITQAIYDAGFNSDSRCYEAADQLLGMRPGQYRAGGRGAAIRFAVGQCTLGVILVARSERGVCAILLGDDPERLVHELQDQFPGAELMGGDRGFEQLVARIVGFVEAPGTGLDLPLDLRGTAFQRRVWQALRRIPAGTTVSYGEIARRIGQPRAARAVAQACAANPLAVAIPCHRVVRRDGAASGYRWGVARKRALQECEARAGCD